MDPMQIFAYGLQYVAINMSLFCLGMIFFVTVENLQPEARPKVKRIFVVMTLTACFTPLGAYLASLFMKRRIPAS